MKDDWIHPSEEVASALAEHRPVVALESTVIAHGLPRPANLETARALEEIVRAAGAVPATIAVLDGVARAGLSPLELERVAMAEKIEKLSTRELPTAIARRSSGATTVASTMFIARAAGIDVFATGGIGGVHHGTPLDVSADLVELGRTTMLVVCAGAKSILDLPATREALESLGVLVVGWRTDDFPAFYTPASGLSVDARVESAGELAAIWKAHRRVGGPGAILTCAPIPDEAALPEERLDAALDAAFRDAEQSGIRGKEITPFLLRAIVAETGGESLQANIALLRNNVEVAARTAVEIAGQ